MRSLALLGFLLLTAAAEPYTDIRPIAVSATPVPLSTADPGAIQVGRLRYMGGLELKSRDARFGGLSGLRWQSPGRLVAITDGGQWVTLNLREEGGRLVGLDSAGVGIVRGPAREPLKGKAHADAEALEIDARGFAVAFEADQRVWHYRAPGGAATSDEFPDPAWLKSLPPNKGVEAMARMKGAWLYLAEAVMPGGYSEGVLAPIGRLSRSYGRVRLTLPQGYVPTDAQALDDDHVLVVGRRFSVAAGMSAVLVSVPVDVAALKLGEPEVLATLTPPLNVDNMEALTVVHEGSRTFVYLASDDNFSPVQRTLLLKFELIKD